MVVDKVKDLIFSLRDTDIVEFELKKGDFRLGFRRDEKTLKSKKSSVSSDVERKDLLEPKKEPEKKLTEIKSTMVGTFFASPSPNRPPLVIEGDHIMPGQKLGMIEAVKVMKDVISTVQGRIDKVLIPNGHAVEYGQPLFLVDIRDPTLV